MQRLGAVPCSRNAAPSPHVSTHLSGPWFSQAWSPCFAATRGSAFHPSDLQSSVRRQREPEGGSAWPVAPHPKANSSGNLTGSSTSWEPPSLAPLLTPPPARRPRGWTGCEGWNGAGKFIFGDRSEPSSRCLAPWERPAAAGSPGPWTPEKQWQDPRADGAVEPREGVEPRVCGGACCVAPVHRAQCWDLRRLPWLEGAGEEPRRDWRAAASAHGDTSSPILLWERTWTGQMCPCPVQPGWLPVCSGWAQGCLVPACLVLRLCHVARE